MLWADDRGRIFEHPRLRMAGFSGGRPVAVRARDLLPVPEFSKLFYLPGCAPMGCDPETGELSFVPRMGGTGKSRGCNAVAAFLEPGIVRSLLPAADYRAKRYTLPMWGYTAVGFRDGRHWAAGFRVEDNPRWDPRNYDDRELMPVIEAFLRDHGKGPLTEHLIRCATENHCFAAKNLFLGRWEAPLPVSRACNAACLGCLSRQPDHSCRASHQRLDFRPEVGELVALGVHHLQNAPEAIVSFGQGCEGEPLTEYELVAESIRRIRRRTTRGTINLNTNGSRPERIAVLVDSGLDSIRISLNSARPDFYHAYYQPQGYEFGDVAESLALCSRSGLFTMINYLVFPGLSDQEEEIEALVELVRRTGVNFVHLKNLCIDPQLYLDRMPVSDSAAVGMRRMAALLQERVPGLQLGYFNQPKNRAPGARCRAPGRCPTAT